MQILRKHGRLNFCKSMTLMAILVSVSNVASHSSGDDKLRVLQACQSPSTAMLAYNFDQDGKGQLKVCLCRA